ncbi:hypothetical protein [Polyangium sp. 6x1]|uniref:hypothetical protein n=1 Tax=Polyangium sp. 6x1 TaxID=3042689 RepID=UPI0024822166|nr:hypothetical protein [Polyangium sp. 6x1]MDI1442651.1 hypothetical protein [Polyangium sp. 6x1]
MRPLLPLMMLALCACKPAPSPEPRPSAGVPAPLTAARAEPTAAASAPDVAVPAASSEDDTHCKCPAQATAGGATADTTGDEAVDDEDAEARKRSAPPRPELPKALVDRLRARWPNHQVACDIASSSPCALQGDLDGDGVFDNMVLVRSRAGAGGIAILWGTGATALLGGGRRGQCWTKTEVADLEGHPVVKPCATEIDANLDWIARWEMRPRTLREGAAVLVGRKGAKTLESPAPGALGDGLLLDGGDAAAILYRTKNGWTLMHLGY